MFDPSSQTLAAVAANHASAYGFAFAAGVAGSVGPCVAPRVIAAASLANGSRATCALRIAALQAGLTTSYCALGTLAALASNMMRHSTILYVLLAALLGYSGVRLLLRDCHCESKDASRTAATSLGSVFLMGASFALIVSPCCTPLVIAIGTFAGSPLRAAALMAAFALGHGLPLAAAAVCAQRLRLTLDNALLRAAMESVSGSLLLSLGVYYAAIA